MVAREVREVDVEDATQLATLNRETLVGAVYLVRRGVRVAVVTPLDGPARRAEEVEVELPPSTLRDFVGAARSDGPTDVSVNKHKYLADAYLSHRSDPDN